MKKETYKAFSLIIKNNNNRKLKGNRIEEKVIFAKNINEIYAAINNDSLFKLGIDRYNIKEVFEFNDSLNFLNLVIAIEDVNGIYIHSTNGKALTLKEATETVNELNKTRMIENKE